MDGRFWPKQTVFTTVVFSLVLDSIFGQTDPLNRLKSDRLFQSTEVAPYVPTVQMGYDIALTPAEFEAKVRAGINSVNAKWEDELTQELQGKLSGLSQDKDPATNLSVYDIEKALYDAEIAMSRQRWEQSSDDFLSEQIDAFIRAKNKVDQTNLDGIQQSYQLALAVEQPLVDANPWQDVLDQASQNVKAYYDGAGLWQAKEDNLMFAWRKWQGDAALAINSGINSVFEAIYSLKDLAAGTVYPMIDDSGNLSWQSTNNTSVQKGQKTKTLENLESVRQTFESNKKLIEDAQTAVRGSLAKEAVTLSNALSQFAGDIGGVSKLTNYQELQNLLGQISSSTRPFYQIAQDMSAYFNTQLSTAYSKYQEWSGQVAKTGRQVLALDYNGDVGRMTYNKKGVLEEKKNATKYLCLGSGTQQTCSPYTIIETVSSTPIDTTSYYTISQEAGGQTSGKIPQCSNGVCSSDSLTYGQLSRLTDGSISGSYTTQYGAVLEPPSLLLAASTTPTEYQYKFTGALTAGYDFNESQIAANDFIRSAITKGWQPTFYNSGSAPATGNLASAIYLNGAVTSQSYKVMNGSTEISALTRRECIDIEVVSACFDVPTLAGAMGLKINVDYNYNDRDAEKYRDSWYSLYTQYGQYANTFSGLIDGLRKWETDAANYRAAYEQLLVDLYGADKTKDLAGGLYAKTIADFDATIGTLESTYNSWFSGSYLADGSTYKSGMAKYQGIYDELMTNKAVWLKTASEQVEAAVYGPNNEQRFIDESTSLISTIKTNIEATKQTSQELAANSDRAWGNLDFYSSYKLLESSLAAKTSEITLLESGGPLAAKIMASALRSSVYMAADADALAKLTPASAISDISTVSPAEALAAKDGYLNMAGFWRNEAGGSGYNFSGRAQIALAEQGQMTLLLAKTGQAMELYQLTANLEKYFLAEASRQLAFAKEFERQAAVLQADGKFIEAKQYLDHAGQLTQAMRTSSKENYNMLINHLEAGIKRDELDYFRPAFDSYRQGIEGFLQKSDQEWLASLNSLRHSAFSVAQKYSYYLESEALISRSKNMVAGNTGTAGQVKDMLGRAAILAKQSVGGSLLDGLGKNIDGILAKVVDIKSVDGLEAKIKDALAGLNDLKGQLTDLDDKLAMVILPNLAVLHDFYQKALSSLSVATGGTMLAYLDDLTRQVNTAIGEKNQQFAKDFARRLTDQNREYGAGYVVRYADGYIMAERLIKSGYFEVNGDARHNGSYKLLEKRQTIAVKAFYEQGVDLIDFDVDQLGQYDAVKLLADKILADDTTHL